MTTTLALLLLAAAPAASAQSLGASEPVVDAPLERPADYRLVWADEFDRDGLPDPERWAYDTHANRGGWYNNELQYYADARRENARVEGGRLIIEARREATSGFADTGGQRYTSARLLTKDRATWRYGFMEVRAKIACGRGLWPAIWTLPAVSDGGWPNSGEIDIMEHVGHEQGQVHGTVHTGAYNHVAGTQRGATRAVPDACETFHDYQLHWTPDEIRIGMDGRGFFRFAREQGGRAVWPFDQAHYLILNVAVGGNWGGAEGVDDAAFPSRMEVEHVRIWQAPDAD